MDPIVNKKERPYQLWWHDKHSDRFLPAGVAFHNENHGDYTLKLDIHPDQKFILRPISTLDDQTEYRIELFYKREGKAPLKRCIGRGVSNYNTNGNVHIELNPYVKALILML